MEHETLIVRRPNDQVRPICSCGWQGTTCRNRSDAEEEAERHEYLDAPEDYDGEELAENLERHGFQS